MNKVDEAIAFLKKVDPGSYFDECAEIIEDLVALVENNKPNTYQPSFEELARLKQMDAGAMYYAKARGLL